jgi:HlyD family secretion protein
MSFYKKLKIMDKVKSYWPFAIPLIVVIIASSYWISKKTNPGPKLIVGIVETEYYDVASEIPGRIKQVYVEVGDTVVKGQTIAKMKPKAADAIDSQAKSTVDAANAQLALVKSGARDGEVQVARNAYLIAQDQLALAEVTWNRVEALFKDSVIAAEERDIAYFKYKSSKNEKNIAFQNYQILKKGARKETIEIAESVKKQAEGAYEFIHTLSENVNLLAPHDGIISSVSIHEEEVVMPASPLITVMDELDFHVIISIPQKEMSSIKIGAILKGKIPGVEDSSKLHEFEVYHTAVQLDFADWLPTNQKSDFDTKTFEIFLRPKADIEGLIPGMTVGFEL